VQEAPGPVLNGHFRDGLITQSSPDCLSFGRPAAVVLSQVLLS